MLYFFYSDQASKQARNQRGRRGAKPTPEKFSSTLEKCVGHSLKNLGTSQNYSPPLVFQAGFGPASKSTFVAWLRYRYDTRNR